MEGHCEVGDRGGCSEVRGGEKEQVKHNLGQTSIFVGELL